MIALAYLWILVLVPLVRDDPDEEVRWHTKHGLVLMGAEFVFWIVIQVVLFASGGLGCLLAPFIGMVFVGFVVVRLACIVRGVNGQRLHLTPVVKPGRPPLSPAAGGEHGVAGAFPKERGAGLRACRARAGGA